MSLTYGLKRAIEVRSAACGEAIQHPLCRPLRGTHGAERLAPLKFQQSSKKTNPTRRPLASARSRKSPMLFLSPAESAA